MNKNIMDTWLVANHAKVRVNLGESKSMTCGAAICCRSVRNTMAFARGLLDADQSAWDLILCDSQ